MLIHHDPSEWESVTTHHTCEYHKKNPEHRSWPGCTCSGSYSMRRRKRKAAKPCPEPDCPIPQGDPPLPLACRCPAHLVIRPGHHIHVDCPVHGKVVLRGPNITHFAGAR